MKASRIIALNNLIRLVRSEKTPEEEAAMDKMFDILEVVTAGLAVIVASQELYDVIKKRKKSTNDDE